MKNEINPKDTSCITKTQKALLNPLYTFENFVVGDSNNFAFLTAKSTGEHSRYNPLFIQGERGTGKTHLLHAIGNVMQLQGKKIIRVTVEKFLSEFTKNLSNRTMDRFKNRYRECDLLLIEDFQYVQGKNQTQEELFHILEALLHENKQIVITSVVNVKQLAEMDEGLKNQIQSGLEVNIQQPEIETRIGIIKKKCEIKRLLLDDETIDYLATTIENNLYEIEGMITKLSAYSELMKIDLTLKFVRNLLEKKIS